MKRYLPLFSTSFLLTTLLAATVTAQSARPQPKPKTAPPQSQGRVPDVTVKNLRPGLGSVKNSVYTNDYFNLRIPVPVGWNVHDEESKRRIMQSGSEQLSTAKPEMADRLDNSLQRTLNLLALDNLNTAAKDGGTAALLVGAEPIPQGQTLTVRQYMETTKRLVMGVPGYELVEEIHTETIGGVECGVMSVKRVMSGITLNQKYIGFIRKQHAIFLVTAYTTEEAGGKLDDVLKRSKLN